MGIVNRILSDIIKKEYEKIKEMQEQEYGLPNVVKQITYEQEMYFMEVLKRENIVEICNTASQIFRGTNSFWSSVSSTDNIPLKHSSITSSIVNIIKAIVSELYQDVDIDEEFKAEQEIWEKINEDQDFSNMLMNILIDILYFGDAIFTVNYVNDKIIINEKYGRNIEYIYDEYDQLKEIVILKKYEANNKKYLLKEILGANELYKKYRLYNEAGEEVALYHVPELQELKDIEITENNEYLKSAFAVQFYITKSMKYKGRGNSIFSNKLDALDSLDEIISQRQSVLRSGAPKEFISDDCIVRDANNRKNISRTSFHKFYEKGTSSLINRSKDIEVLQSEIKADEYRISEDDARKRVYEGILSEQTVLNTSTVNNTSISKEREKLTNYTIATIKKAFQTKLPEFICNCIKIYCIYNNIHTEITPDAINVNFAEFGNPTFETQVQVCAEIKRNKILPNFEMLKELYGETKTDEELQEIANRLDIMDGYTEKDNKNIENEEEAV